MTRGFIAVSSIARMHVRLKLISAMRAAELARDAASELAAVCYAYGIIDAMQNLNLITTSSAIRCRAFLKQVHERTIPGNSMDA